MLIENIFQHPHQIGQALARCETVFETPEFLGIISVEVSDKVKGTSAETAKKIGQTFLNLPDSAVRKTSGKKCSNLTVRSIRIVVEKLQRVVANMLAAIVSSV